MSPAGVKSLCGADEAEVAFCDQVGEGQPASCVVAGNADHKTEVGCDQPVERLPVALAGGRHRAGLFLPAEGRILSDVFQIEVRRFSRKLL